MNRHIDVLHDFYGSDIRKGSTVAYNYSGEVRIGTVISLQKWQANKTWGHVFRYKIEVEEKSSRFISKVTSPLNLVVINDRREHREDIPRSQD